MKPKLTLLFTLIITCLMTLGQRSAIELTFSAVNNTTHVQLDSIKIMNRTQGGETMIYWPDTTISLEITPGDLLLYIGHATLSPFGVQEISQDIEQFKLFPNFPNPVYDQSTVSMWIPETGVLNVMVMDVQGRIILADDWKLDRGHHFFRFIPGNGNLFFLTASWNGVVQSIKILTTEHQGGQRCMLDYKGSIQGENVSKASPQANNLISQQSGILDTPLEDQSYTFQFATNIPCPGTSTVEYEGQVYNTIQIFSQCWLKENLNVGEMIAGTTEQSNNQSIEKYCFNNESDSCTKYGGLYQWDEMMQYGLLPGAQGICPVGWHLPTDEEWKILEGAVDSEYGIGDPEWDIEYWDYRGFDAGTNLKTTSGWYENDNGTDLFGFSALPGGGYYSGYFDDNVGFWWTSTQKGYPYAWYRYLPDDGPELRRYSDDKEDSFSVRCLQGVIYIPLMELTFTAVNNDAHVQLDSIKVMNRTFEGEIVLLYPDSVLVLGSELPYVNGDELILIGYSGTLESGRFDSPLESQAYTFQFATNIPCPGTPTVEYEGQVYNTIQIFSQCWLKENLNVGTMIEGTMEQSNNGTIEKYCYNNEPDSCTKYGGLYQWNEMMQYTTWQGTQSICPPGWYVPTDEEWKVLEGAVDSQYGIGDPEWDDTGLRGYDAGGNLKEADVTHWTSPNTGATNSSGFTGLPGGCRDGDGGNFWGFGYIGFFWSSSQYNASDTWDRGLFYDYTNVGRYDDFKGYGCPVRCLKDTP